MNLLFQKILATGTIFIILWVLLVIIMFFIIREITLWYFRINENTDNIKRIADSLEKLAIANDFIASDIDQKNDPLIFDNKDISKDE
jgi:hypothetical protein